MLFPNQPAEESITIRAHSKRELTATRVSHTLIDTPDLFATPSQSEPATTGNRGKMPNTTTQTAACTLVALQAYPSSYLFSTSARATKANPALRHNALPPPIPEPSSETSHYHSKASATAHPRSLFPVSLKV
jgi:hypothetical protein